MFSKAISQINPHVVYQFMKKLVISLLQREIMCQLQLTSVAVVAMPTDGEVSTLFNIVYVS